MVLNDFVILK